MAWKNSKYVITLKQLATIIEKCHGWPLADENGNPVIDTWDVDPTSTVELHELITCQDCEHWKRFWPEEKELYGFLARVGELLLPGSALYLNRSLLESNPDTDNMPDHPEDELIMVPHCNADEQPVLRKVYLRDMALPSLNSSGVTIINIVHSYVRVCGYFAAHTEDYASGSQLIKRLSDVMNLIASVQLGRMRQQQLVARLENNLYMDSIAGLSNLKGLTRWYEYYVTQDSARGRILAVSVYGLPRYSWIYETYGMAETEDVVRTALSSKFGRAKFFSDDFFPYALYYLGLMTFEDEMTLNIPNLTIRNMFVDYYDELSEFTNVDEARRCFGHAAKDLAMKDGTWKALFDAYWQHYVKARIPAQAFDKMNENFFRTTFTSRCLDALAAYYSFETEYNSPEGRCDFLAVPKAGSPKPAMLVEFKYFTNEAAEKGKVLGRDEPDKETVDQALAYRMALARRPDWDHPILTAVVEVCGNTGYNWFDLP